MEQDKNKQEKKLLTPVVSSSLNEKTKNNTSDINEPLEDIPSINVAISSESVDKEIRANVQKGKFVPIADLGELGTEDSNFVFYFGKASIGKTVILASMLYHMNAIAGSIRPKHNMPNTKEAEVLLFDLLDGIKRGKFPNRTQKDIVTRIDLVFEPNNKSKKVTPIELTFLEIAGDNHMEVRRGGKFHRSIEEYLNADIPLNFILVTDYENANEDDTLMFSFLNELGRKGRNYRYLNVILVIAKWDKSGSMGVSSSDQLEEFIRDNMPMTSSQIDNYSFSKTYFTVGNVGVEDGKEVLLQLNLSTAKLLTEWLYESITHVDLNYEGTFLERLFGR